MINANAYFKRMKEEQEKGLERGAAAALVHQQRAPGPATGRAPPLSRGAPPPEERGRGHQVTGADAAGDRPFLRGHPASLRRCGPPRFELRPGMWAGGNAKRKEPI